MHGPLEPSQFEQLSAQFDGELDPQASARVQRLLEDEPAWREAHAELEALDRTLEAWDVPASPGGLAEGVIGRLPRRRPVVVRLARWLIPVAAAAAAAIILAVVWRAQLRTALPPQPTATQDRTGDGAGAAVWDDLIVQTGDDVWSQAVGEDTVEQLVREHLEFFRDYGVVANFETLEAIDELVSDDPGV